MQSVLISFKFVHPCLLLCLLCYVCLLLCLLCYVCLLLMFCIVIFMFYLIWWPRAAYKIYF